MKLLRTTYLKSSGQQNIDEHEYPMLPDSVQKKSIEKKKNSDSKNVKIKKHK